MRRSTAVFAIFFAMTYLPTFAFAQEAKNHGLKPRQLAGENSCRASTYRGVKRNSIKLYRQVQHVYGKRKPGRNIVCDGVRTNHGVLKASLEQVKAWHDVLARMILPVQPAVQGTVTSWPTSGTAYGSGSTSSGTLQAIAQCESGGNPAAVSPGGTYRGMYQFDQQTWESVGGTGDPAAASVGEQTKRAEILMSRSGSSPWPICGR